MTKLDLYNVLKVQNLSIGYRTRTQTHTIASNINLKLKKGALIGLIGTNGIGKSTLLKTLTQVHPPLSGSITINEKPLETYNAVSLAKTMSVVLTEPLATKNLSVFELVALGRQPYTNWVGSLHDTDLKAIEKAMTLVAIEDLKYKKCYELSDGQLQKVMIARALAQDTDLIILDEPTTHLDLYHKAYILKLLQNLAKTTDKTILFSSHDIDLAIQLCDTIIVMTPQAVVTDSPTHLIEKGVFNTLFPDDLITFNTAKGHFRLKT
jgi:iron complex transport system ATP-binding protein